MTLAYAGLFAIAMLAILLVGGTAATLVIEGRLRAAVEAEVAALMATAARDDLPALERAIAERSEATREEGFSYLLTKDDQALRAASIDPMAIEPGWLDFVPPGGEDDDEPHVAQALLLEDGSWLVVAVDAESLYDTQELMLAGTAWTLAIALPLALVCGWMIAVTVLRRIEAVTEVTMQVRDGGLDKRVPLRGSNDEFDRLVLGINSMLDSIEALTRNIQQVSVGIAHDLRTPLTRIRNKLEDLRREGSASEHLAQKVDDAITETGSVLATFDALLRIGQIDAGTRRAGFREIDLSALVAELAETYEPVASAHHKTLNADVAPGILVQGDRPLLVQMIANLLENAVEHTPANTAISLALFRREGAPLLVVADNGPGIPEAEHARVFERFYRLDRSRHTEGSGLGLSIVRAIATLHGVAIGLHSASPGLLVELRFPAEPGKPSP